MSQPLVHKLSNGFTIAIEPIEGVGSISLNLHAAVGSRHEAADQNGIAHLFEHMVFNGAGSRDQVELSKAIEDVGGSFNAYTTYDHTVFQTRLLSDSLDLGANILADLVLEPHFHEEELEREKDVVLQELNDANDDPSDIVHTLMQSTAYPDQSMGRHILGSERTVRSINPDHLHAWSENHYTSGSMVLSVAGKVDIQEVIQIAESRFGALPVAGAPINDPIQFHGGSNYDDRALESAHIMFAFEAPGGGDEDRRPLQIFSHAIGGGFASRLFRKVRGEHGLVYNISSMNQQWMDTGQFGVYLATDPKEARRALQMTLDIIHDAVDTFTDDELKRAKIQTKSQSLMALESVKKRAMRNGNRLITYGEIIPITQSLALLDAVTIQDVKRVAARVLSGPMACSTVGWNGND